jgi:hypothetical protein
MRRSTLALGGALALAAALAAGPATATAQETGSVFVVHGIPDTPVDVYVDGRRAIDDFAPISQQGPIDLPAGGRTVAIFPADAADGSGSPLLSARADVPAGGNVTLVAHLDEGGSPTISPFVNDVSPVPAGQGRVVLRHTAAAPAVDALADGRPVLRGLTNGDQEAVEVPAGTLVASLAPAGATQPVLGPALQDVAEGTVTFVHAVGSLERQSLDMIAFVVGDLHSSPSGVDSGAPSGAPGTHGVPGWVLVGTVLGLAVAGVSARRLYAGGRR